MACSQRPRRCESKFSPVVRHREERPYRPSRVAARCPPPVQRRAGLARLPNLPLTGGGLPAFSVPFHGGTCCIAAARRGPRCPTNPGEDAAQPSPNPPHYSGLSLGTWPCATGKDRASYPLCPQIDRLASILPAARWPVPCRQDPPQTERARLRFSDCESGGPPRSTPQ